jgi:hypothetical protein
MAVPGFSCASKCVDWEKEGMVWCVQRIRYQLLCSTATQNPGNAE